MALAPTAVLASAPGTPDAVLISLCARLVAVRAEEEALAARLMDLLPSHPDHDSIIARIHELSDGSAQLARHVGQMPTETMAGVKARAAALQAVVAITTASAG